MATRQSVEEFLQRADQTIEKAEHQFIEANKQEHINNEEYTNAMQELENSYNELADLAHSCNGQQREQLHRLRLRIQQLQNTMTLHDY